MKASTRFFIGIPFLILALDLLSNWSDIRLPRDVVNALDTASTVTLYSLQPFQRERPDLPEWDFYRNHVLGHIDLHGEPAKQAIEAFESVPIPVTALLPGKWELQCRFVPRHALRVLSEGHIYDLLLCYQCGQLEVLRDKETIAFVSAGGTPKVLNGLLTGANIPLADTPASQNEGYADEAKLALRMAEQGNIEAQSVIAGMYSYGLGVKKDPTEALKWYRRAADQGDTEAQGRLGWMYESGDGVKQDPEEAYFWALLGDNPFDTFDNLTPGQKSAVKKRAIEWNRKAADQGVAQAQYYVGYMHSVGRDGMKQDDTDAVKWLRKAADQNYVEAQRLLGEMYEGGRGVTKDNADAYFWLSLAANAGNKEAAAQRDVIMPQLMSEQKSDVENRLKEWKPTSPAAATKP